MKINDLNILLMEDQEELVTELKNIDGVTSVEPLLIFREGQYSDTADITLSSIKEAMLIVFTAPQKTREAQESLHALIEGLDSGNMKARIRDRRIGLRIEAF